MRSSGRVALFCAAVGLAGCAERDSQVEAFTALKEARPAVRSYERAERTTRLYGAPLAEGDSPRASAEAFRTTRADLFGVDPDDLVIESVAPVPGFSAPGVGQDAQPLMYDRATGRYRFSLYRYVQEKDGIPVYGSSLRVVVRNERPYPAVLAVSALRDVRGFAARAKRGVVDRQKANAAVRAVRERTDFAGKPVSSADPQLDHFSEPELVVWAGVEDDRVAPRVAVTFVADNYGARVRGGPRGGASSRMRRPETSCTPRASSSSTT